MFKLKLSAW